MNVARRWAVVLAGVALVATVLPACLVAPADTSQIVLVSSSTFNGWRYDYYRNGVYPCAVSGYQTFMVGTLRRLVGNRSDAVVGLDARRQRVLVRCFAHAATQLGAVVRGVRDVAAIRPHERRNVVQGAPLG